MVDTTAKRFDAVLFDLDDTLMPEMASEREALLATCAAASEKGVEPATLANSLMDKAGELWGSWGKADHYRSIGYSRWEGLWGPHGGENEDSGLGDLARWLPDYRQKAWDAALHAHGVRDTELRDRLISLYRQEREARMGPFPDTVGVLESLRGQYRLALVTNGAPAVQRHKYCRAKLAGFFEFIAVSGAIGAAKPDPRPFTKTLDALGVSPERALMVGNSSYSDVGGAKGAGIFAVWLNRDGSEERVAEADAEISSLSELSALL